MLSLLEILGNKMVLSIKHVISSFFKKSDTGDDQNTLCRSNLNHVIENVETEGERGCIRRIL